MTEQWEKQKRELDSYNLFFSSFRGLVAQDSLFDLGYRLAGSFVEVPDNRAGVSSEPDFALYNGEILLLVEVKSGTNINERVIKQMERANEISIEAGQDFLADAEIYHDDLDPNSLSQIQSAVVFYSNFLQECRASEGCRQALDELSDEAAVLSQKKGGSLILEEGQVHSNELRSLLTDGIELPKLPEKNIYLTENTNRGTLAYSICHDCVLNNLGNGRIELTESDVVDRYKNRQIHPNQLADSLDFLDQIGACTKNSESQYVFTRSRLKQIMGVEEKLEQKRVVDWLEGVERSQRRLNDFESNNEESDSES